MALVNYTINHYCDGELYQTKNIQEEKNDGGGTLHIISIQDNILSIEGYRYSDYELISNAAIADENHDGHTLIYVDEGAIIDLYYYANSGTIYYLANGGTVSGKYTVDEDGLIWDSASNPYFESCYYGEKKNPADPNLFGLEKTGYTFAGWAVSEDIILSPNEEYDGAVYGDVSNFDDIDCYLTALWTVNQYECNIKINISNNGTTTLATAGKYCDRNIDVNVDVDVDDTQAYEAGQKAEYDRFWDLFQQNGNRTSYNYAFSTGGWTDENFKPKYDIIASSGDRLFAQSGITDLVACLEFNGVTLDTSKVTIPTQLCGFCYSLTTLPKIDLSSATTNAGTFADDGKLKTIEELVVSANTPFHSTTFRNCTSLENMIVTGTIGQSNFDVHWSTKLSKASIESIINSLSSTTSGLTVTISKTAKEAAFTDAEWATLIATKSNWTISLA